MLTFFKKKKTGQKKEDELEAEHRKDLIMKIRAIERVSVVRCKPYDPSEPPRQGLLDEMSYAELQERMKLVEADAKREEENRRKLMIKNREEKKVDVSAKAQNLDRVRARAKIEAEERRAKHKVKLAADEKAKKEFGDMKLREGLAIIAKKKAAREAAERKRLKELKETQDRRRFEVEEKIDELEIISEKSEIGT